MSNLLQKKSPVSPHYSYTFLDAIISSVLVFVCLISFKPTFISELSLPTQLLLSTIISSIVLIVLFFKYLLVDKMARSGNWTFKMDLLTLFSVLLTITLLLIGFSQLIIKTWLKLSIILDGEYYLKIIGLVYLIGILLYFASLSAKFLLFSSSVTHQTFEEIISSKGSRKEEINSKSKLIHIEGKNQGEYIEIEKENLVCISTNGHYIEIFTTDENRQKLKKIIYRNSILSILDLLKEHEEFIHCHRSHVINIHHVKSISGNSKKMELTIENSNLKIPVSRSKSTLIYQIIKT